MKQNWWSRRSPCWWCFPCLCVQCTRLIHIMDSNEVNCSYELPLHSLHDVYLLGRQPIFWRHPPQLSCYWLVESSCHYLFLSSTCGPCFTTISCRTSGFKKQRKNSAIKPKCWDVSNPIWTERHLGRRSLNLIRRSRLSFVDDSCCGMSNVTFRTAPSIGGLSCFSFISMSPLWAHVDLLAIYRSQSRNERLI